MRKKNLRRVHDAVKETLAKVKNANADGPSGADSAKILLRPREEQEEVEKATKEDAADEEGGRQQGLREERDCRCVRRRRPRLLAVRVGVFGRTKNRNGVAHRQGASVELQVDPPDRPS